MATGRAAGNMHTEVCTAGHTATIHTLGAIAKRKWTTIRPLLPFRTRRDTIRNCNQQYGADKLNCKISPFYCNVSTVIKEPRHFLQTKYYAALADSTKSHDYLEKE